MPVNLIALSSGSLRGWVAPAVHQLSSINTPLERPLTAEEVSWIGAITYVGALLGSLSISVLTLKIGCKRVVAFLAFPAIIFWMLIFFGNTYYYILLARFIAGWTSVGVESTVILFISEIANDEVRGRLGSATSFFRHVGILIGFILGANVEYMYIPWICVTVPITFLIVFLMVPNTPRYYLNKGQDQKAEKTLKFYKGYDRKTMRRSSTIYKELERLKTITNTPKNDEKFLLSNFCERDALRGLGIGFALVIFGQLTASTAIVSYAVMTFAKFGTTIDPYISSIAIAVALILGSFTTTSLVDVLGRKKLNLMSLLGSAVGLLAASLYHYLRLEGYDLSSYAWIPMLSLSFVIYVTSAGIVPLTSICSVEYLPTKVRTYGIAIICCFLSITSFVSAKMYPMLLSSLDLHGCLSIYAVGCVVGFFFVLFVMDETKGKALDDVGTDDSKQAEITAETKLNT